MLQTLWHLRDVFFYTMVDVTPIAVIIVFYQFVVIRRPIPNPRKVMLGMLYVVLGLSMFLVGLEKALFPIGDAMARQLSGPSFIGIEAGSEAPWYAYKWIYIFAASIGFATAIAEPSLIAVAIKADEVSAGTVDSLGLRIAVALGVAFALALGTYRIVTGTQLYMYILGGYVIVIIQTIFAPRYIIPLAYDSGGVATSTVTVPIVAALGLGLSSAIPGRNPALDGFGLIALACLFPIVAVMGYVQFRSIILRKTKPN